MFYLLLRGRSAYLLTAVMGSPAASVEMRGGYL